METPPDSPAPKKGPYKLLRDQNVLRVRQATALVLAARAELEKAIAKQKGGKPLIDSEMRGTGVVRRSLRRAGKPVRKAEKGKRSREMRSARDSSSEATEFDGDVIVTGMMHLAIAYTHVERQSDKEKKAGVRASLAGSEEDLMDSSEDDLEMEEEEPLLDKRMKRKKTTAVHGAPVHNAALPRPPPPIESSQPNLAWVPGHYMPVPPQAQTAWTSAAAPAVPDVWAGHNAGALPEDMGDHNARRKRKVDYDLGVRQRATAGVKPNQVFVLPGGEVDSTCKGKNAWDEVVRDLVPKCLDMSVVDWTKHEAGTLKKLRAALDNEFEYVGNPLSMVGFRVAVTKYMKAERCRLKTRFLKGLDCPPLHIDEGEWERLKEYWNTDKQKEKARKMAVARRNVKNWSSGGRRGKSALPDSTGGGAETSPGVMDDGSGSLTSARHRRGSNVNSPTASKGS